MGHRLIRLSSDFTVKSSQDLVSRGHGQVSGLDGQVSGHSQVDSLHWRISLQTELRHHETNERRST